MGLIDEAVEKLDQFESGDEFAWFLEGQGIRGPAGNVRDCPTARLLRQWFPDVAWTVSLWTFWDSSDLMEIRFLPAAIAAFVKKFDHGDYPSLEGATEEDVSVW